MQKCIGIINSGYTDESFGSLCKLRPDYMLPFGGRYRIIDFELSNVSNSNLPNVILYAGKNIRSTLDHVGSGKNWELNRRRNGLIINPPRYDARTSRPSEVASYYDNMPFYENTRATSAYIVNPMVICKLNIKDAYDKFVNEDLDVLLVYKSMNDPEGRYLNSDKLILNSDHKLVNIGLNLGTEDEFNLYLGKLFIKMDVFKRLIKESMEKGNANTIIQAILNVKNQLKIGTYEVESHVEYIRDIPSFYEANMNLLNMDIYKELFNKGAMILTKSKDEPSTRYAEGAQVRNSLVANGCTIEGQVENSIIFRGVTIHKNAIVRNSIVFQETIVEEDAIVVNTITDKYGFVPKGTSLVGSPLNPYVVEKGTKKRSYK